MQNRMNICLQYPSQIMFMFVSAEEECVVFDAKEEMYFLSVKCYYPKFTLWVRE